MDAPDPDERAAARGRARSLGDRDRPRRQPAADAALERDRRGSGGTPTATTSGARRRTARTTSRPRTTRSSRSPPAARRRSRSPSEPMTLNDIEDFAERRRATSRTGRASTPTTPRPTSRRASSRTAASSTTSRSATRPARSCGRRAPLPVDRKLIYVEPDPSPTPAPPDPAAPAVDWNGIADGAGRGAEDPARRGDPRRHPDGADSATARSSGRATSSSARAPTRSSTAYVSAVAFEDVSGATWADLSLEAHDPVAQLGPGVRDLSPAEGARPRRLPRARSSSARPGSTPNRTTCSRCTTSCAPGRTRASPSSRRAGSLSENHLLIDFSLPYRWRRLSFVLKKLKQLALRRPRGRSARALPGCGLELDALPGGRRAGRAARAAARRHHGRGRALRGRAAARRTAGAAHRVAGGARHRARRPADDPREPRRRRHAGERRDAARAHRPGQLHRRHRGGEDGDRGRVERVAQRGRARRSAAGHRGQPRRRDRPRLGAEVRGALLLRRLRGVRPAALPARVRHGDRGDEPGRDPAHQPASMRSCRPTRPTRTATCAASGSTTSARFFDLEWRKHDMLWGRLNAAEIADPHARPRRRRSGAADRRGAPQDRRGVRGRARAGDPARASPGSGSWTTTRRTRPHASRRSPCSTAPRRCMGAVVGGIQSGPPAAIAPGWAVLRSVMRPNPGGWSAVLRAGKLIFLRTTVGQSVARGVDRGCSWPGSC